MKIFWCLVIAVALQAARPMAAVAQTGRPQWLSRAAHPGMMVKIVPGVWYDWADPNEGITDSQIVIEMKDYLIVVDATFPLGSRKLISDIKKIPEISAKPIKYVIDTHSDEDHCYGNVLFTRMGAITIGYIGLVKELELYEPQTWQRVSEHRKDVAELHLPTVELPIIAYTKSPYIISDSTRRVELYYFGWAHTRGDTFVYLPKEKVLCTGDAVPSGPHSDPKKGWIANWPKVVEAAQKLDVKYVLPAHGVPGGPELLEEERRFLVEMYAAVKNAINEGKMLNQLVTFKDGRPVATSIQLSKSVMETSVLDSPLNHEAGYHHVIPGRFASQIVDTYEEITQGKPYGEIAAEQFFSRLPTGVRAKKELHMLGFVPSCSH